MIPINSVSNLFTKYTNSDTESVRMEGSDKVKKPAEERQLQLKWQVRANWKLKGHIE